MFSHLFGGRIRHASQEWAYMYAKRWSVEKLLGHWKYPGRLEQHCYVGLAFQRNLTHLLIRRKADSAGLMVGTDERSQHRP